MRVRVRVVASWSAVPRDPCSLSRNAPPRVWGAQAALIEMGAVPAGTSHAVRTPNVTLNGAQRAAVLEGLRALRFFEETARGPRCGDGLVRW